MRDKFKGKQLDYRKSWRSCRGFSLEKHFNQLFPESKMRWTVRLRDFTLWQWWYNKERDWISEKIGVDTVFEGRGVGPVPSWFRKGLNRNRRAKEKQSLRRAFCNDNFDDFLLPKQKRNLRWLYW